MNEIAMIGRPSIRERVSAEEWAARTTLAACYRLVAKYGMTDLVYNHITSRVPGPDHHILINAYGYLYSEITASNLYKIDVEGEVVLRTGAGEQLLSAGMCAGFPAGVPDGHQLLNRSDRPAAYLELSNRDPADGCEYPDVDLRWNPPHAPGAFTRRDGTPYRNP